VGAQGPDRLVRVIAVYKFAKTTLLTAVGLGALRLLQPKVLAVLDAWAATLAARHERRLVVRLISWVSGLHPHRLEAFAVGAFVFAALFLTEGVGLWLGKRWGGYLTVVATTLFVPLEVVQLARVVTPAHVVTLLLNLAIVVLLVDYLRRHPPHGMAPTGVEG
jgi:uncharacterized membrane protein (DUF2068 family)